ncbi:MAG: hypothetical protein HOO88_09855 [Kiritimatiellaceae bacterium]|nr:hypothetical protein [Kiritimatiellaceae bacterium]
MKPQILFLIPSLLIGVSHAETGTPKDIREAGRIRIDGNLDDWKQIKWTPLTQTLDGNPENISNAQWALRWNDDGFLYIAVRYDDSSLLLHDSYVGSNAQDCIELFIRGDTGSQPNDYSKLQNSAQHYIFGLAKNKTAAWKKLANVNPFPMHNPASVAITLSGKTLTYEIMVPLYDKFDASSRRHSKMTEVAPEFEVGVDIAIVDVGANGYAGRKSENTMPDKECNADRIAEHTLGE